MVSVRIVGLLVLVIVSSTLFIGSPAMADTDLPIGGQGQIAYTDGEGVRIREDATSSSDTLKLLEEGWRVTVMAGPISGENGATWYKVNHTGVVGHVMADFLTTATGATGGLQVGGEAQIVTDDGTMLRLREEPQGEVLMTMPAGGEVEVLGGPATDGTNSRWYHVAYDGTRGWALGAYLRPAQTKEVEEAAPARATTSRSGQRTASPPAADPPAAKKPAPAPTAAPAPAPAVVRRSSGGGAAIVETARQYLGSRYVFGGASPSGFDCSGFVNYVVRQALGVQLGRDVYSQVGVGVPVAPGDLQPGDLIFQKNTYRWGLSHVGIYVGNGMMINAQSESAGVRYAPIWDSYWGPRFYAARRIVN